MADSSAFPRLEGLLDLARGEGFDIRPTLLRVLTDLYVQTDMRRPEDERQYTELAFRLIDAADVQTRAAVAERLASDPGAPIAVVQRLARDVIEVAAPVLKMSPCLTPTDLVAIANECGEAHALAIAQRNQPVAVDRATNLSLDASAAAHAEAVELCELFFAAGGPERRLILMGLDYLAGAPPQLPAPLQRNDVWSLESAALQHKSEAVVQGVERALGVSARLARRILQDELGEPFVVAAKAMNLPTDVLQRMLLFVHPNVGQSVDRVYELAALYGDISVDAACRLVAIWRDAEPACAIPPRHEILALERAASSARRALSEIAHPQAAKRDTLLLSRGAAAQKIAKR